ncbi:UNVERIFIED_CONTAM: hypothetical protein RMT77_001144 [Armadillidium vulgare]
MLWIVVIAAVANVQHVLSACNYCKDNASIHTMCKPVKKAPCGTSHTFNDKEKAKILKFHNDIRRKTASGKETNTSGKLPPACEMCDMQWNEEAAKIAQTHTNNCKFEHDKGRSLCDGTHCGQNIAMGFYTPNKPSNPIIDVVIKLIDQFYTNEVKIFRSDQVCSYKFNSNSGHYSQLIWANSCHIGCGLTYFQEDGKWNYLVACNYCKAGNIIGEKVYKTPCDATPHCDDCC